MKITADALLGRTPGWHDGSGVVTYSFSDTAPPAYYGTTDTDGDGTPDAWRVGLGLHVRFSDFAPIGAADRALALAALSAWDAVCGVHLQAASGTGDIMISVEPLLRHSGSPDRGLFGFARFPQPADLGTTPSKAGDLWINTNNPHQKPIYGHTGWQTYLHELGHALGLHHPNEDPNNVARASNNNNQWTVMSYVEHPSQSSLSLNAQGWPITPMVLDIQAMQKLYGANTSTRTGDTVYLGDTGGLYTEGAFQFATSATPAAEVMKVKGSDNVLRTAIFTIWDAGGTDVIDASHLTTPVSIDLRPGHYSSIGAKNNVGVAAAVRKHGRIINLIENANGGTADDRLTGNDGHNHLFGSAGNDRLYGRGSWDGLVGGDGNDRVFGGDGNDKLFGNKGKDWLAGGNGNDKLLGGGARDRIHGGAGDDTLNGGSGNDILNGQAGADTIFTGSGRDRVWFDVGYGLDRVEDFQDNVDELVFFGTLGVHSVSDVLAHASTLRGGVVFSFGTGADQLYVAGIADPALLADDIVVI